jgi:hypothetical protein
MARPRLNDGGRAYRLQGAFGGWVDGLYDLSRVSLDGLSMDVFLGVSVGEGKQHAFTPEMDSVLPWAYSITQ